MKKIFFLLFIIIISLSGYSQRFIGSIIAGGNLSQVDGDEVFGYKKFGFNGGGSVMLSLDKKERFFFTVELLYTQKGSYLKSRVDSMIFTGNTEDINTAFSYNSKVKYRLRLDYVEVPILFHYEDRNTGCSIGAGVSWARLVNAQEIESGYRLYTNMRSGTYTKNDWCVLGDIKIPLYKNLKLNFRFQYSFLKIRTRTYTGTQDGLVWNRKQYNNVLTLRLIYTFNEKFVPNTKKNKEGKRIGPRWVRDTQF